MLGFTGQICVVARSEGWMRQAWPWEFRPVLHGGCGYSVMCEVQSSRSSFLRSRVEKVSEAGSRLRGKEHYQRFVMFDKE